LPPQIQIAGCTQPEIFCINHLSGAIGSEVLFIFVGFDRNADENKLRDNIEIEWVKFFVELTLNLIVQSIVFNKERFSSFALKQKMGWCIEMIELQFIKFGTVIRLLCELFFVDCGRYNLLLSMPVFFFGQLYRKCTVICTLYSDYCNR